MSQSETTAVTTDVAILDTLDPAAREVAVTSMLDQARQWLERAKESTTSAQDVAEFKSFIATVAEAAKQKKLSEDIQLDAIEMVRRSERALGLAIRDGQQRGAIATNASPRAQPAYTRIRNGVEEQIQPRDLEPTARLQSPNAYFGNSQERAETYAVTDGVSDEAFDMAVSVAKDEGNLSRSNVIRKVTEITTFKEQQADKWEQIADFASRGFTSSQIAKTVGYSESHLRSQAKLRGITFPADKIVGVRRIDPLKVLENVVASIEASESALALVTFEDVTPELALELLERLEPGRSAITRLIKTLKEIK